MIPMVGYTKFRSAEADVFTWVLQICLSPVNKIESGRQRKKLEDDHKGDRKEIISSQASKGCVWNELADGMN